jgi:hypothetical protein
VICSRRQNQSLNDSLFSLAMSLKSAIPTV